MSFCQAVQLGTPPVDSVASGWALLPRLAQIQAKDLPQLTSKLWEIMGN